MKKTLIFDHGQKAKFRTLIAIDQRIWLRGRQYSWYIHVRPRMVVSCAAEVPFELNIGLARGTNVSNSRGSHNVY